MNDDFIQPSFTQPPPDNMIASWLRQHSDMMAVSGATGIVRGVLVEMAPNKYLHYCVISRLLRENNDITCVFCVTESRGAGADAAGIVQR